MLGLLAGASFLALAAVAARQSRHRYGVLAASAGAAWLAADLSPALLLLHRPLVLHAALALPTGRVRGRSSWCLLVLAWTGAVLAPLGRHPLWMLLLAALALAEAVRRRSGPATLSGVGTAAAAPALALLALALALPAVARVAPVPVGAAVPVAALYEALTLGAGLALLVACALRAARRETDVVLELAQRTGAQTASALRHAAAERKDPADRSALTAAAELLEANAALQAELTAKVEQVRASRRRLVDAVDAERRRLEGGVAAAVRYLHELSDALQELAEEQPCPAAAECREEVARSLEDLRLLADGLHPRVLTEHGLGPALTDLAQHCPVPTRVQAPPARLAPAVESAIWYACAEAVANAVKHAGASRLGIQVRVVDGSAVARVHDDGAGGAQLRPGGGLTGLADRAGALGGRLDVQSAPGSGTTLTIRVPLC